VLPEKLGRLTEAVAEILELHRETLDLSDEKSRAEDAAYAALTERHHKTARELLAVAEQMAGYRDLPMGRHDEAAFADPRQFAAFETLVRLEREVVVLLEARLSEEEAMLRQMGRGNGGPVPG
jgi:hypothetical protein